MWCGDLGRWGAPQGKRWEVCCREQPDGSTGVVRYVVAFDKVKSEMRLLVLLCEDRQLNSWLRTIKVFILIYVSAVSALKTVSWYLPHNDAAQNLAIIQREAHTQNVQAHSLALPYRGRARTIVHAARTLIFAFKLGVDWLQVWWAQAKKPSISPPYTPLVDGGQRTNDNLHGLEIRVPKTLASVARLPTVDDISTPSYSSRPRATTTIHALEIYLPASSTEPSSCCSGPQLITLFSICVITLVLIITASSTPRKPKLNPTSNTHPPSARQNRRETRIPS